MGQWRRFFRSLTNAGLSSRSSIIQRRRIRILNIFNLIGAIIILSYFTVNLIVGTLGQAFTILTGLVVLTIPVYVLNFKKLTEAAKLYFVLVAIAFINLMAYKTLFQFEHRDNDFIMIGFSTLIIVLFDNPLKFLLFCFNAGLAISLKVARIWLYQPDTLLSDNWFSIMNMLTAFVCVYFFTDIYKVDVRRSEGRIRSFAERMERQKFLVQSERDELVYNKQLIRTTIDNLPVFIAMMDAKGKFIIVNSRFEKALKLKLEEIEGRNYYEVLGNRISKLAQPLFDRCLTGVDSEIDHPVFFPSGEIIHAFGKYMPLMNEKGTVTHVLAFVTDIRKLKKTESKLREINSSKDKILSILSHDLRSPLGSLSMLLAHADSVDTSALKKMLKDVKNHVDILSFTLDNVLSWVKTQLGGFVARPQVVNLRLIVQNSLDLYRERLKEKKIKGNLDLEDEILVNIDPAHLDIVVRNLISNAIKFSPRGKEILVTASNSKANVCLSIKDSGQGMERKTVERITSGLSKNKPLTTLGTEGEQGTGLGLNFCLDILKLNHSKMKIKSKEGEGTEIVISMPSG